MNRERPSECPETYTGHESTDIPKQVRQRRLGIREEKLTEDNPLTVNK